MTREMTDYASFDKDQFDDDVKAAADVIRRGGVILYPTDTVWGLGCDATNPKAVARLYEIKKRSDSKSMLALLGSIDDLYRWLKNVPETALQLIEVAVDPLTIIYDSPLGIAENLTAPDGSLGIRISSERFCRSLCRKTRLPIVSTSANISGEKTPAVFSEISDEIKNAVDFIPFYRRDDNRHRRPSGIIKVRDDETLTIIR